MYDQLENEESISKLINIGKELQEEMNINNINSNPVENENKEVKKEDPATVSNYSREKYLLSVEKEKAEYDRVHNLINETRNSAQNVKLF